MYTQVKEIGIIVMPQNSHRIQKISNSLEMGTIFPLHNDKIWKKKSKVFPNNNRKGEGERKLQKSGIYWNVKENS